MEKNQIINSVNRIDSSLNMIKKLNPNSTVEDILNRIKELKEQVKFENNSNEMQLDNLEKDILNWKNLHIKIRNKKNILKNTINLSDNSSEDTNSDDIEIMKKYYDSDINPDYNIVETFENNEKQDSNLSDYEVIEDFSELKQEPKPESKQEPKPEPKPEKLIIPDDIKNRELTLGDTKYKEEFDAFVKYCEENNLNPKEELYKIQKKMGIKNDFMFFGQATAKYIYRNNPDIYIKYSSKQSVIDRAKGYKNNISENKNFEVNKIMQDFYKGLEGYQTKTEKYTKDGITYDIKARYSSFLKKEKNIQFGRLNNSEPITGTAIAKGLKNIISDSKLSGKVKSNNVYLFRNSNDKKFTLVYFQDGKVKLATYASPGNPKVKGGEYTQKSKGKIGFGLDKNHISMSTNSDNIKLNQKTKTGTAWAMPYSVSIPDIDLNNKKGEFIHASTEVNGELASHGCVRIPPFYSKIFYDNTKIYKPKFEILEVV